MFNEITYDVQVVSDSKAMRITQSTLTWHIKITFGSVIWRFSLQNTTGANICGNTLGFYILSSFLILVIFFGAAMTWKMLQHSKSTWMTNLRFLVVENGRNGHQTLFTERSILNMHGSE